MANCEHLELKIKKLKSEIFYLKDLINFFKSELDNQHVYLNALFELPHFLSEIDGRFVNVFCSSEIIRDVKNVVMMYCNGAIEVQAAIMKAKHNVECLLECSEFLQTLVQKHGLEDDEKKDLEDFSNFLFNFKKCIDSRILYYNSCLHNYF